MRRNSRAKIQWFLRQSGRRSRKSVRMWVFSGARETALLLQHPQRGPLGHEWSRQLLPAARLLLAVLHRMIPLTITPSCAGWNCSCSPRTSGPLVPLASCCFCSSCTLQRLALFCSSARGTCVRSPPTSISKAGPTLLDCDFGSAASAMFLS